jgi:hypothetical protein
MKTEKKEKVLVPFQCERKRKDMLLKWCRANDMSLSQLVRKLLREFEEKNGIGDK